MNLSAEEPSAEELFHEMQPPLIGYITYTHISIHSLSLSLDV